MDATSKADLSRITIVGGQRSGQPCIRGLRESTQTWKGRFPALSAYASQADRERRSR